MRIGLIYRGDVSNVNYRAVWPARALQAAGHDVRVSLVRDDYGFDVKQLQGCDVVHVYRLAGAPIRACVEDLRRRGIAVTWDNDDDLRLLSAEARRHTGIRAREFQQDSQDQARLLPLVDLVTTTTDLLVERFGLMGAAAVSKIPNYLAREQYASAGRHPGLVIGWLAGGEHYADVRLLSMSDVIRRTLASHPGVRVVTIGVALDVDDHRYEHVRFVPMPRLAEHLRRFDIGIAPIADIPMNHARSDVKVKEYAACGAAWLASPRGPYATLGEREGGRLVEDDGWERALAELLSSSFTRYRLRRRAARWAKTQCIDQHVGVWIDAFERAIMAAESRRAAGRRLA